MQSQSSTVHITIYSDVKWFFALACERANASEDISSKARNWCLSSEKPKTDAKSDSETSLGTSLVYLNTCFLQPISWTMLCSRHHKGLTACSLGSTQTQFTVSTQAQLLHTPVQQGAELPPSTGWKIFHVFCSTISFWSLGSTTHLCRTGQ